jgi:hypothetical protein
MGPDTSYCLKDPVTQAPGGYNKYFWKKQLAEFTNKLITVYPLSTTQYISSAQTALACSKRQHLITIKVPDPVCWATIPVCAGDSILNAEAAFRI